MWARAAVERLGELIRAQPGLIQASIKGSERGAESLSPRPFQGILESLQNADDLGATKLKLLVHQRGRRRELLIVHDGSHVQLSHVAAMILPWVTTKADDPSASGRFGIGQKTLTSLGGPISIHCSPFHVVMEAEGPSPATPYPPVGGFYEPKRGETLLVIPLHASVDVDEMRDFVESLGAESLLFLNSVRRLALFDLKTGKPEIEHRLIQGRQVDAPIKVGETNVTAERSELRDPRRRCRYIRYMLELPLAKGERRYHKATGKTATLGVAAIATGEGRGRIYDRLPSPINLPFPFSLNAQFDPDTARSTLLPREWNAHRIADLGRVIAAVARDCFSRDPALGWRLVPLRSEVTDLNEWIDERMKAMVSSVQADIIEKLRLRADGELRPLSDLVYESANVDGLLSAQDLKLLRPDEHPLDDECRDPAGRWREILDDFALSRAIDTDEALNIFDLNDTELGERQPDWYVRMAKAAIDSDELESLLTKRSVLMANGERIEPPGDNDPRSLVRTVNPRSLAAALDIALLVNPAYLEDTPIASLVSRKLEEQGVLVDECDSDDSALEILARSINGYTLGGVRLDDSQLLSLRDAFERCDQERQREIGPKIGSNIELRTIVYKTAGETEIEWISPTRAYLPATIDRERDTFAKAAQKTPGLHWLDPAYARLLKRTGGRKELGAQRFLTRLGASISPRLTRPENEVRRYQSDSRLASRVGGIARPELQLREIRALPDHRSNLIDDHWSPDLDAVMSDIAQDRNKSRSRRRALALLGVIVRSWDRRYADHQHARAVYTSYGLQDPREVIATWLARACTMPWLPSAAGVLSRPMDLCLDTEANRLAYGGEKSIFLCKVDAQVRRSPALQALRLRRGPSASDLVSRLSELREQPVTAETESEAAGIYHQLALACPQEGRPRPVDDMTVAEFKRSFTSEYGRRGLLLIDGTWYAPGKVLRGPQIFGGYRPFVLNSPSLEPLWRLLAIPEPTARDCLVVLHEIDKRPFNRADQATILETFRALAAHLGSLSPQQRARLKGLPLLVHKGWVKTRPVFAIEDEYLASRFAEKIPVWRSGFTSYSELVNLLDALGVTLIEPDDFELISSNASAVLASEDIRKQFSLSVGHLQDGLARGDEPLYHAISVPWTVLLGAQLVIDENLQLSTRFGRRLIVDADAHLHRDPLTIVVRREEQLGAADIGGRVIANLFIGDRQKVAWAWASMWERARDGIASAGFVLSGEERDEGPSDRLVKLQGQAKRRQSRGGRRDPTKGDAHSGIIEIRALKEITDLEPDEGAYVNVGKSKQGIVLPSRIERKEKGDVGREQPGSSAKSKPRTRSVLPPTSEREQLALDAVQTALRLDRSEIADLRARRGIGADAMDDFRQLFEIKMSSTADFPSEVTLTRSEVDAAQSDPDFFLAVVCGLEDSAGDLRVRFIFNPLERLAPRLKGEMTLTGVDEVEALEYVLTKFRVGKEPPRKSAG